jgi:hypothetical protein
MVSCVRFSAGSGTGGLQRVRDERYTSRKYTIQEI